MSGPRHSKDANEASWDVLRTAKELTLLEASYICCGLPPFTHEERRLTNTAHPANIHAMARRLRAEVPNEKVRTRYWRTYDWIFQAAAVWDFAKQNGFRLPWEESAPSSATPTDTLLRVVAALALALAEKSDKYRCGTKPNASQIDEAVQAILAELPDANTRGLSSTIIRDSISAGLRLLATDDKTGKTLRPFLSD